MTPILKVLAAVAVLGVLAAQPAAADGHGSLFVNLTTDEGHRANMALVFSKSTKEKGHPVTIWLNDKAVFLGSRAHTEKHSAQQQQLAELMAQGVTVIACPFCMKHYGIKDTDLLSGIKVGNPDLTGGLLFKEDAKTLTW
jgi:predicted peroxiredoxin